MNECFARHAVAAVHFACKTDNYAEGGGFLADLRGVVGRNDRDAILTQGVRGWVDASTDL